MCSSSSSSSSLFTFAHHRRFGQLAAGCCGPRRGSHRLLPAVVRLTRHGGRHLRARACVPCIAGLGHTIDTTHLQPSRPLVFGSGASTMLAPGQLVRCPCLWPRAPERFTLEYGYLVPGPHDVLRILYVGEARTGDAGWLYCLVVCGAQAEAPPAHRCGWIPKWAVLRLRAPGPVWRLAWDGRRYPLAAWCQYYGEEAGLRFWERAPH